MFVKEKLSMENGKPKDKKDILIVSFLLLYIYKP